MKMEWLTVESLYSFLTKWMIGISFWDLVTITVAVYIVYWFLTPKNTVKKLSDVGYGHLDNRGKRRRVDIVVESRSRRVIGNLPPIYPNGWFVLADSNEITAKQVKHVTALGNQFAVFRSEDGGKINVVSAICPHMGANIAVGGSVSGNCITCPFHGWTFDGSNGKCISIPYSTGIPAEASIRRWHSCEVNTFVFVWFHAENEEPTWLPDVIPQVQNNVWWYRGRTEHYINAHIQEIPENGADITHLPVLHGPIVFAGSDLFGMRRRWCSIACHKWKASWAARTDDGKGHIGLMHLFSETIFFNKYSLFEVNVRSEQIGPGYVVMNVATSLGPVIILQTVTPVEPLLQKVVHKIFYPFSASLYGTLLYFTESILFERDVIVWNHKKYEDKPLLTKEESSITKHRRWYSQFYSKNSPTYQNLTQW